jgi:hypothetical protein
MLKATAVWMIGILVGLIALTEARADEFELKPFLAVRGEYIDNIFFDPNDEVDDVILIIRPGLELIHRTERLDTNLSAAVAPFFYLDNSEFDDVNQNYNGRIDYKFTPKFNGRTDAFYIVDNLPDRDIVGTGLVQGVDTRERYHFGAGANYLLSEKAVMDLAYDYNRDDWDKNASDREDLTQNVVDLDFSYNLGDWLEVTTGLLSFEYGSYDYDTSNTESFSGGAGLHRMLSETYSLEVRLGARYVDSEFDVVEKSGSEPVIGQESNSGWGGVGQAILEYEGEKTRGSFLASHDLSGVSGQQGPTQLTRIIFSISHRLQEDLRLGLMTGLYRNKADEGDFSTQEIETYTFDVSPNIRWEFFENFTLESGYRFTYLRNEVANTSAARNTIYIQLAYGLPLFEYLDLFSAQGQQVLSGAWPVPEPR